MPIWPWKANIRPKACRRHPPRARRAARLRFATTYGSGANGASAAESATGPAPGPAAAVRRREGLVQVDVHRVDAEIAGTHLADDGVEVGAVAIEERAGRVDRVGDRDHVGLEQAAGVGVGDHDRGDVGREMLLDRLEIDRPSARAGMFSTR